MFSILLLCLDISNLFFLFPCNIFILIVNILDWKKKKRLPTSDTIITAISVSNLVLGVMKISRSVTTVYNISSVKRTNLIIIVIAMSCNIWFSTWLCVHFCLKIVKIHHCFYIYLQRTFHQKLPWILVLSVGESVLMSLYAFSNDLVNNSMMNVSQTIWSFKFESRNFLLFLIPCVFGVVLFASSSLTIAYTLCRHIKVLRKNSQGFRSSTAETHIRASIIVVSLFILCLILCVNVIMMCLRLPGQNLQYTVTSLTFVCNILSYVGLIKGNYKLDKALREMINYLICSSSPA